MRPIEARRRVPRPREELYAMLADLRSHWQLAGRWVEPLELHDGGGTVRVRAPLGLRRTIETRLTDAREPECVAGEARLRGTRAAICWLLEADGATGSLVTLRADLLEVAPLERALLAVGGRWWMARRFEAILQRLG